MTIRAIYENGSLRLLDPVDLKPGQQVTITIELSSDQAFSQSEDVPRSEPSNNRANWNTAIDQMIHRVFQEEPSVKSQIVRNEDSGKT